MSAHTMEFKTEVQQLLDLVIHSLYSKKEIFLRELISNASDAIDRIRFEALTNPALAGDDSDWKIRITPDEKARTLTISDNGIGMTAADVQQNIGTIANSGTRLFLENLKKGGGASDVEFIGQFGVGFYSAFMVAEKVTVRTRRAGTDAREGVQWVSEGKGTYSLEEVQLEHRGTEVVLHLREGMDEFVDPWRIRQIVRQYSDYIAHPIVMAGDGKDETLNSMRAIWRKARTEVKEEEYREFYRHISHDPEAPLETIHFAAEGATEFRALVFIPSVAQLDLFVHPHHRGLHLYVKNVMITDDCKELLPSYLRFIRGIVDSSDLPLNVSREMLQDDAIIRRIRKGLVSRILSTLDDVRKKRPADYTAFFSHFGRILKEGIPEDAENQDKLRDLLLFPSSKTEPAQPVSLKDYVGRMPSSQKEIYYLPAESIDAARTSPHLEAFKARDLEVLFLVDPIDEWVTQHLTEYEGRKLKAVNRGKLDLDPIAAAGGDGTKDKAEKPLSSALLERIQKQLDADVQEVRLSNRLTDSACCLVSDENAIPPAMARMMKAMHQEPPKSKRILELNPVHPVFAALESVFERTPDAPEIPEYIGLLYGQALVLEGSPLPDPQAFAKGISRLMVAAASPAK